MLDSVVVEVEPIERQIFKHVQGCVAEVIAGRVQISKHAKLLKVFGQFAEVVVAQVE